MGIILQEKYDGRSLRMPIERITLPSTVAEFVGMIGKVVKHIIRSIDVRRLTPKIGERHVHVTSLAFGWL